MQFVSETLPPTICWLQTHKVHINALQKFSVDLSMILVRPFVIYMLFETITPKF